MVRSIQIAMRFKSSIAFLLLCGSVVGAVQARRTDVCGESCKMKVVGGSSLQILVCDLLLLASAGM